MWFSKTSNHSFTGGNIAHSFPDETSVWSKELLEFKSKFLNNPKLLLYRRHQSSTVIHPPLLYRRRSLTGSHTFYKWKNWRSLLFRPKKMAEKMRKWQRQILATNIRKSRKCKLFCGKMAYLLKNMIFVCVYLTFTQWLNRIRRKLAVRSSNTVQTYLLCLLSLKLGGKSQKLAEFKL